MDRHIPTHIHTNTHTPTHHPRQVCLLCLCCTALHVFSQGQSERCPRSHQEKITLNVFRCLAATNNQTLKSHFPFTELLSLETFRSFYITWRPQSRSDVNEPQTKEGEAQTSAAALKKRLTYRRCQEPDLSSERHAEHQALTMNCGYSDNHSPLLQAKNSNKSQ